ncbi:hypothetical protein CYJ57_00425 [Falseniella ignava]|uniref:RQC P-site tRNA stabilizing factor n=1 Tax=Falseniella ignava TaxID=137730 RepID=A0A2I1K4U6_9LACT|nr:RNA-binding S4 domain-containing protein [Falseniella ignava]PKY90673.1 hypothetical protein CYJ57_00425 [Falseniella ignava]
MRLDKFLKVSRIIKRRTVAKEVADQGRVKANGQVAKSSTKLKVGDELEIQFGQRIVTYRIVSLLDSAKKEDAEKMYEIIQEERIETEKDLFFN